MLTSTLYQLLLVCMVSGVHFRDRMLVHMGNTLSGCVTQDPRVGPSETCAIHPTHAVHLVACMCEP